MQSLRTLYARAVLIFSLSAAASAQTIPLAYKCIGEPYTYALHTEARGKLISTSLSGDVDVATTLENVLDLEFTVTPVHKLEDGSYLVDVGISKFTMRSQLPGQGSDIRLLKLGDTLAVMHNSGSTVVTIPNPDTALPPPVDHEAPGLAALAKWLGGRERLSISPTGDVRRDPAQAASATAGLVEPASFLRFPSMPVKVKGQWAAKFLVHIPGVLTGQTDATFTLDGIESENNGRWAVITVESKSALASGDQPIFGSGSRLRLESMQHQLKGTFRFAVDRGRTVSQETLATVALRAAKVSPSGDRTGSMELHMTVSSKIELLPTEGEPIEPSP